VIVGLVFLGGGLVGAWWRGGSLWDDIGLARVMLPLAFFLGSAFFMKLLYGGYLVRRKGRWTVQGRSIFSSALGALIYGMALSVGLGLLPIVVSGMRSGLVWKTAATAGTFAVMRAASVSAAGAGANLMARTLSALVKRAALALATPVFVLGTLLLLAQLALMLEVSNATELARLGGIFCLVGVAGLVLLGVLVDYNRLSPHYFYRDRLAETFLRTDRRWKGRLLTVRDDSDLRMRNLHGRLLQKEEEQVDSSDALRALVHDFNEENAPDNRWLSARGRYGFGLVKNPAPYHLVVCAINLAGSRDLTRRSIKSDTFIMSRLFCGSCTTGYVPTDVYRHGSLKPSHAMAISGAAASSGMGVYTSGAQAFASTLFNLRLGHWMPNPLRYVGVVHELPVDLSRRQSSVEGVEDELGTHVIRESPADDLAAVKVEDDGQVGPALVGPHVRDVGCPHLVRLTRLERPLDEVRGEAKVVS
jgi:hypothetical protein